MPLYLLADFCIFLLFSHDLWPKHEAIASSPTHMTIQIMSFQLQAIRTLLFCSFSPFAANSLHFLRIFIQLYLSCESNPLLGMYTLNVQHSQLNLLPASSYPTLCTEFVSTLCSVWTFLGLLLWPSLKSITFNLSNLSFCCLH